MKNENVQLMCEFIYTGDNAKYRYGDQNKSMYSKYLIRGVLQNYVTDNKGVIQSVVLAENKLYCAAIKEVKVLPDVNKTLIVKLFSVVKSTFYSMERHNCNQCGCNINPDSTTCSCKSVNIKFIDEYLKI